MTKVSDCPLLRELEFDMHRVQRDALSEYTASHPPANVPPDLPTEQDCTDGKRAPDPS